MTGRASGSERDGIDRRTSDRPQSPVCLGAGAASEPYRRRHVSVAGNRCGTSKLRGFQTAEITKWTPTRQADKEHMGVICGTDKTPDRMMEFRCPWTHHNVDLDLNLERIPDTWAPLLFPLTFPVLTSTARLGSARAKDRMRPEPNSYRAHAAVRTILGRWLQRSDIAGAI